MLQKRGSKSSDNKEGAIEDNHDRDTWSSKLDFVMSALSFAVGMGNIWRFPYLAYRNGGGAFLIPYLLMVVLAGFPVMFMELAFGQFGSLGVVSIWRAVPLFQGIGWCMFSISFISCIYYNMLIAYSFFYLFASFTSEVPWSSCNNDWNTPGCGGIFDLVAQRNCSLSNGTWFNGTCYQNRSLPSVAYTILNTTLNASSVDLSKLKPRSSADEYFHFNMLDISGGISDLGGVRWQLALCLLLCWVTVFVCLSKGIKSSGKVSYITSVFPYIILVILLVRGLTLEGSTEGILYYLTPDFSRLASAKVWGDAAVQVFFSMSTCWGGLITLASYNKFHNNCLRDSLVVSFGDCLTSIFGGVVIFAIIGFMAHELGVPVDEVATQGAGLAFIVYPSVVSRLPISPLWAILFMLMLVNLGIGTQFTLVTTTHTTLMDVFSRHLRRGRRPLLLLLAICMFSFLVGLIITTQGGMYVLQLMDTYAPSYALLVGGLCELLALGWIYGIDRFMKDIEQMLGKKPSIFFKVIWRYVTPLLIVGILLFTFIDYQPSSYGDYEYPIYAEVIGFFIVAFEIGMIPGVAIYQIYCSDVKGSLITKIKHLCRPADNWGPAFERKQKKQNLIDMALESKEPLNA
ncbi:hypothetical protein CAPTEDRAFT_115714 [Capitella teleta]|uniref:Transporter n=1 Tax=Capitella teleta TaxID=283909 RepID=R7USJ1_CAPTE|nr:hypothetical protein CAPTEDRAFT_115714 [Capitella teleta]|eukprot:ELU09479.1 hypothetical protein CAPTEDRAFT_115714 [Capitella teleta]